MPIYIYAATRVWERPRGRIQPGSTYFPDTMIVYWRKYSLIESKSYTVGLYLKKIDDIALARFHDDDRDADEQADAFIMRMATRQKREQDEYCLRWLKMGLRMNPHELSLLSEIISGGRVDATVVKDWMMDRM